MIAAILVLLAAGTATESAPPEATSKRTLSAAEIAHGMAPHVDGVGACFKKHALGNKGVTGELRLELVVAPTGRIHRLRVVAPGVSHLRLQRCVATVLSAVWFAAKDGYTVAVIPFLFQRTQARGAGPVLSCWKKTGCPAPEGQKP